MEHGAKKRKLTRPADFQRFAGKLVKVLLKEPPQGEMAGSRRLKGRIAAFHDGVLTLDLDGGQSVAVVLENIERANLVLEWQGGKSRC